MQDYVNCHRCGTLLDSSMATRTGGDWYCNKCYEIHKAYEDGYSDGWNDKRCDTRGA